MGKYILLLMFITGHYINAQSVNSYRAVIVPVKYDFLKNENDYRLNTLTKFNVTKAGFDAFYTTEMSQEEYSNRCNLLFLDVQKENGFMITKLFVTLKDCNGKLIFQSKTGKSKEKDFEKAYFEALNEAFESVYALNYKYDGNINKATETSVKSETAEKKLIEESVSILTIEKSAVNTTTAASDFLYAQPIINGFQFVDTTPKVVMKILKTSSTSCYIATKGEEQGVLIAKNDEWYFEYYKDQKLISEKVAVKF